MSKLSVFNFISLDGYYKGLNNGIDWHEHGQEEGDFSAENLGQDNILLFGRVTYQMMASWWPTQNAFDTMPEVAKGMNNAEKIVCYQVMIDPIAIGNGTAIFKGMQHQLMLKLTDTRSFKSGTVLLSYEAI